MAFWNREKLSEHQKWVKEFVSSMKTYSFICDSYPSFRDRYMSDWKEHGATYEDLRDRAELAIKIFDDGRTSGHLAPLVCMAIYVYRFEDIPSVAGYKVMESEFLAAVEKELVRVKIPATVI